MHNKVEFWEAEVWGSKFVKLTSRDSGFFLKLTTSTIGWIKRVVGSNLCQGKLLYGSRAFCLGQFMFDRCQLE